MHGHRKQEHDTENPPGQINNSKEVHKLAYKREKTLGDIIDNVKKHDEIVKKRLTFSEWWKKNRDWFGDITTTDAADIWNAAQENV